MITGTSFESFRSAGEARPRLDAMAASSGESGSVLGSREIVPPYSPLTAVASGAVATSAARHLSEPFVRSGYESSLSDWCLKSPPAESKGRAAACSRILRCIEKNSPNLDLSSLGLSELPEEVFCNISQLRTLLLANNQLSSLPSDFDCLTELVHLDVSDNVFPDLPLSLSCLKRLSSIDLSSNQLTELPEHLLGLPYLDIVKCADNPLSCEPATNHERFSSPLIFYTWSGKAASASPSGYAKNRLAFPRNPPMRLTRDEEGRVIGGYQKTHKKHGYYHQLHSNVLSESNKEYALLNYLTTFDKALVKRNHGVGLAQGKVVFGKGGYGTARLAKALPSEELLAVKKVSKQEAAEAEYEVAKSIKASAFERGFTKEDLQEKLLLVTDRARIDRVDGKRGRYQKTYLFMPFASGGDGLKKLQQIRALNRLPDARSQTDQIVFDLIRQCVANVALLHELGFTHRDIKPENFLFDKFDQNVSGELLSPKGKLADFGLAHDFSYNSQTKGGTREYLPPEYRKAGCYDALKHDSFSLGLTLLQSLSTVRTCHGAHGFRLELPLKDGSTVKLELQAQFRHGRICFDGFHLSSANVEQLAEGSVVNVIALLLAKDPASRITAIQANERLKACSKLD